MRNIYILAFKIEKSLGEEHLPCKYEALTLNSSNIKKENGENDYSNAEKYHML
jgi:hypothetical protein